MQGMRKLSTHKCDSPENIAEKKLCLQVMAVAGEWRIEGLRSRFGILVDNLINDGYLELFNTKTDRRVRVRLTGKEDDL